MAVQRALLPFLFTLLLPAQSFAVAILCVDAAGIPCVTNAGDLLAGGVLVPTNGNDKEEIVEAAIESATGVFVDILLVGKSDENPGLFSFNNFDTGTGLVNSHSGNWTSLAADLIFYITVKAANSFALFEFSPATNSGSYSTLGLLNNGGQMATVSHISFWTANGATEVPEPGTLLLFGSGLLGAMGLRRQKKSAVA